MAGAVLWKNMKLSVERMAEETLDTFEGVVSRACRMTAEQMTRQVMQRYDSLTFVPSINAAFDGGVAVRIKIGKWRYQNLIEAIRCGSHWKCVVPLLTSLVQLLWTREDSLLFA
jgi:hypothetical protein